MITVDSWSIEVIKNNKYCVSCRFSNAPVYEYIEKSKKDTSEDKMDQAYGDWKRKSEQLDRPAA